MLNIFQEWWEFVYLYDLPVRDLLGSFMTWLDYEGEMSMWFVINWKGLNLFQDISDSMPDYKVFTWPTWRISSKAKWFYKEVLVILPSKYFIYFKCFKIVLAYPSTTIYIISTDSACNRNEGPAVQLTVWNNGAGKPIKLWQELVH